MSNKHLLQKKWFLISWLNPILYVDDLLFINNDTNKLEWLTSQLMKEYEITNPRQMWIYNIKFIHLPIILSSCNNYISKRCSIDLDWLIEMDSHKVFMNEGMKLLK